MTDATVDHPVRQQRDLSAGVLDLFERTDWPLFREQKIALLGVLRMLDLNGREKDAEYLAGLLHFIDAVQDCADEFGYPAFRADRDTQP